MKPDKRTRELRLPELLLFASADVFGGGGQALLSVLFLVFLTNILRIPPAWAGAVVMISKIWDAVSDPMMGVLSDNTRSRFGRRKPYLFVGGLLLVLSLAWLWLPIRFESQMAQVVFVTAAYLFYNTVSTIISVPYSSMSTEITTDFALRNRVNMMRLVFSLAATAVCTLLPTILFDRLTADTLSQNAFYAIIVLGFGLAMAVPVMLTGLFAQERAPYDQKRSKFSFSLFLKPLRVRAFRKLLILYLAQSLTMDTISSVIIYYSLYLVPGVSSTVFLGTFLGMQLLLFPIFSRLVNKVSKTKLYRFGLPLSVIAAIGIALFPAGGPVIVVYLLSGLTALGFAGAQTMNWIIFPDVVDIGELSLGERNTGSFSGIMTFIRKASSAVAIFFIGTALDLAGFITPSDLVAVPAQPSAVLLAIRLIILVSFALFMGIAWYTAGRFALTPALSLRVKHLLEARQGGRLTAEDQAELTETLREFG